MEFPSKELAEALCFELNRNEAYRKAARGWRWPILFKVEEDGGAGPGFILDLYEGECRGFKWFDNTSGVTADYVLSASKDTWLKVIKGELHPMKAILEKKVRLEKGSYATIARYTRAALEIVKAARSVLGE